VHFFDFFQIFRQNIAEHEYLAVPGNAEIFLRTAYSVIKI